MPRLLPASSVTSLGFGCTEAPCMLRPTVLACPNPGKARPLPPPHRFLKSRPPVLPSTDRKPDSAVMSKVGGGGEPSLGPLICTSAWSSMLPLWGCK